MFNVVFTLFMFGAILKCFKHVLIFNDVHPPVRKGPGRWKSPAGLAVAMARARSSINSTKMLQTLQNCPQGMEVCLHLSSKARFPTNTLLFFFSLAAFTSSPGHMIKRSFEFQLNGLLPYA